MGLGQAASSWAPSPGPILARPSGGGPGAAPWGRARSPGRSDRAKHQSALDQGHGLGAAGGCHGEYSVEPFFHRRPPQGGDRTGLALARAEGASLTHQHVQVRTTPPVVSGHAPTSTNPLPTLLLRFLLSPQMVGVREMRTGAAWKSWLSLPVFFQNKTIYAGSSESFLNFAGLR